MRMLRLAALCAVVATCLLALSLGAPSTASANVEHFCGGVVNPGQTCASSGVTHWDRVRSRFDGYQAENVYACVYMYNHATNQIRGLTYYCAYTWSHPTWNPMGHNYGVTTQPNYRSLNYLPPSNPGGHWLTGWTSDNQTDG